MDPYPPISTFLSLRRWIGYVGLSLPWLVTLFAWRICPSISDTYYAGPTACTWFVGSLFTIGAFLCSYFGHDNADRRMSSVAGICAFGVALFPTDRDEATRSTLVGITHYIFAAGLFLILAWFSRFQFIKTTPGSEPTPQKKKRNKIYVACGYGIVACLAVLLVLKLTPLGKWLKPVHAVFWLEALALEIFGFSWMIKGETFLKDDPPPGAPATLKPPSS